VLLLTLPRGTREDRVGEPKDLDALLNCLPALLTSSAISALARNAARDASISRSAMVWKEPGPLAAACAAAVAGEPCACSSSWL